MLLGEAQGNDKILRHEDNREGTSGEDEASGEHTQREANSPVCEIPLCGVDRVLVH